MSTETFDLPKIRVRGRSIMALILAPEAPFAQWFAALDEQMHASAALFDNRPIVVDLGAALESVGPEAVLVALDGLSARGLKLIGVEGLRPAALGGTPWSHLPTNLHGNVARKARSDVAAAVAPEASDAPAPVSPSLLIDRPVRSGQSVIFEEGDVTIVGPVASGAEVIAGGSIHVYGALRGRAIAGLRTGAEARIFCRRLEAELVGVDHLYRTAEHWGPDLHGQAVQVRCDRGALRLSALG
ncbi:septum site-determining protein MinC [Phenylobacterium sp.]|uniref:septum site-determining protein MinC n=1 Tax=Phenylobacterium sp. TaxID=1871053 RepID=UPI0025D08D4F|nr:septum site-determining protein MinC [Phenylobacterium sp.]